MLTLVQPEKEYTSAELAKKLGIATATLRKYNFYFSKVGVHFKKEKGKLIYTEEDLKLFRKLIKMNETSGTNLETCVAELSKDLKTVVSVSDSVSDVVPTTTTVTEPSQHVLLEERLLKQMEEHMEMQTQQLNEMKEYIDSRLEERDEKLTKAIRDIQQVKEKQQQGFFHWIKSLFIRK